MTSQASAALAAPTSSPYYPVAAAAMLRYLPSKLIQHRYLTEKQRTTLSAIPEKELSKYEVEAIGQLLEMLIRDFDKGWVNYFAIPADGLCAGRALVTNQLREDYLFTTEEIAAGRLAVEAAGPARLIALYFQAAAVRRQRMLARLRSLADTASKTTNTKVGFASDLAA